MRSEAGECGGRDVCEQECPKEALANERSASGRCRRGEVGDGPLSWGRVSEQFRGP